MLHTYSYVGGDLEMKPYEVSVLINGELAFTTSASRSLRAHKRLVRWATRKSKQLDELPDDTVIEVVWRMINEIKTERFIKGEL